MARRTGKLNMRSASSTRPFRCAPPPDSTRPAGISRGKTAALQFVANQREQFLRSRFDNFVQHSRKDRARRTIADAGDLDRMILQNQVLEDAAMLALDFFRFGNRRAQSDGKIVGEMIAAHRNGRRVAQHSIAENNELRRAAADIEQAAAQFALILREARFRRSQRLEHGIRHFDSRLVHGNHQILHRRSRGSHQMHVDFEALADHAQRIANIVVRVEQKFLREHVQHDAILGKRDIARRIHGVANIVAIDVPRAMPERDSAAAVHAANVAAGDADDRALDGHAGDAFGFFDRAPDRSRRRADIGDQALAQSLGFRRAHGDEFHARFIHFADDGARLRAADVQRDQIFIFLRQPAAPSISLPLGRGRVRSGASLKIRLPLLCARLSRARARSAPRFAATVLASGFTTTCRANRKSTESTLPALVRHWSTFSASK